MPLLSLGTLTTRANPNVIAHQDFKRSISVSAAVLILITMVIQFGSFRQAVIVLIVIPLAVSSVFLAFALTGTPLSFPALIGVLSLFGIVVTNQRSHCQCGCQ